MELRLYSESLVAREPNYEVLTVRVALPLDSNLTKPENILQFPLSCQAHVLAGVGKDALARVNISGATTLSLAFSEMRCPSLLDESVSSRSGTHT